MTGLIKRMRFLSGFRVLQILTLYLTECSCISLVVAIPARMMCR